MAIHELEPMTALMERVKKMSKRELIEWLGPSENSLQLEVYKSSLPKDFEYVSGPQGLHCIDFCFRLPRYKLDRFKQFDTR